MRKERIWRKAKKVLRIKKFLKNFFTTNIPLKLLSLGLAILLWLYLRVFGK